jgi:hypothetical protein
VSGVLVINLVLAVMVWGLLGLVVAVVLWATGADPGEGEQDGGDDWRRGPPPPDPPRPVRPSGGHTHPAGAPCRQPVGGPAGRVVTSPRRVVTRRRGDLTHTPRVPSSPRPPACR